MLVGRRTSPSNLPALAAKSPAIGTVEFDLTGVIGSVGMLGATGFVLLFPGDSNTYLLLGGAMLYGVFYQINQVQMPAMVNAMYGEREYDKIFPVAAIFSPWVGAVSFSLWGFIFDAFGSYTLMLVTGMTLSIVTAITGILAVSASKKLKREVDRK